MKTYFLVVDPTGDIEEPYGLFCTDGDIYEIQSIISKCYDTEHMYETLEALGCEEIPYDTLEF